MYHPIHNTPQAEVGLEPTHLVLQTNAMTIYATQQSREGIEPSSFD